MRYVVFADGVVQVHYSLQVKPGLPNLPKVGLQMGIDSSLQQLQYWGRGPMENYIDRRYGTNEAVYQQSLSAFLQTYVVPQENSNRTDVRWFFAQQRNAQNGLLIVADSLLSMSVWPYSVANLTTAKHTNALKPAGYLTMNVDLMQMGVGGNDSWSDVAAPLEKYQIKPNNYQYSFYIVPFNAKKKSAGERAKEIK